MVAEHQWGAALSPHLDTNNSCYCSTPPFSEHNTAFEELLKFRFAF